MAIIEEFTTFSPRYTYEQIRKCSMFTYYFTKMFNANEVRFHGTVFAKVNELAPKFDYVMTHGILDDPNGPEYSSSRKTVKDMRKAIEDVLKSGYIIVDSDVKTSMLDVYNILAYKKSKKSK